MIDSFRSTKMTSVGLTGILALTFYLRFLYFGQIIDGDVGNLGYLAWRMAEGEVLLDLEGPGKPPLYFMLYAVFIRLFGPSVLGLKIFGTIFVLMAVVATYWLANQAYGKKAGLLAALLFGVFSSCPMVEGGGVNLETVLHLPYILTIGMFFKAAESGQLRWSFFTGLCAAVATLVKQVGGILVFVFLCYGIDEWRRKPPGFERKQWLYRHLLFAVGAFLPVIGVVIFYQFHGYTLTQLYQSMLGSNLHYIRRGYDYTDFLDFFYSSMRVILTENGLLWGGTIFTTIYLGWRIRRGKGEASDRILLWWAFWSFAVLCMVGTFYYHYFLQIIGPFSVLTAFGIVAAWKWTKSLSPSPRAVSRGVGALFLGIAIIILVKTDYSYFFLYTPEEQTAFQYKVSEGVFDGYGVYNVMLQQVAFHIGAHTDPNETIYVWGIAPQIFFLAQRKAATRYRNNYSMSRLVTNDSFKALRAYAPMVMEDIGKSQPAYIVQIFRFEDFPELQRFVQDYYAMDTSMELSFPPFIIRLYRRCRDIEAGPNLR